MHFEVWDVASRNVLANFETEGEALAAVRDLLAIITSDPADEMVLVWRDADGGGTAS